MIDNDGVLPTLASEKKINERERDREKKRGRESLLRRALYTTFFIDRIRACTQTSVTIGRSFLIKLTTW